MLPLSVMRERMPNADASGLQICTHAIGDQAISMVLDLYSEVEAATAMPTAVSIDTPSTWRQRILTVQDCT